MGGWGSCEGITQIGLEVGEGWAVRWSSSRVGHAPNRILSSSDPRATPHRSRTDQHLQPPKAVIDQPMTPHRPPSNLDSALHRGRVKLVPPTSVRHRFSRLHDHVPLPSGEQGCLPDEFRIDTPFEGVARGWKAPEGGAELAQVVTVCDEVEVGEDERVGERVEDELERGDGGE